MHQTVIFNNTSNDENDDDDDNGKWFVDPWFIGWYDSEDSAELPAIWLTTMAWNHVHRHTYFSHKNDDDDNTDEDDDDDNNNDNCRRFYSNSLLFR